MTAPQVFTHKGSHFKQQLKLKVSDMKTNLQILLPLLTVSLVWLG